MTKYLMGIDNGSTMVKAGLFDIQGNEVAVCSVRCGTISPQPGWYERDMDELWEANRKAISGAILKSGIDPSDILAVSLTGHGNGAHLVDELGNPVRNTIEGADIRAQRYVEQWNKDGTFEKLHPKSMQALWPALSICVFAWLKDNEPETLDKTKWMLFVKDYARMKLTGVANLEFSDASGSGLLNVKDKKIDRSMLETVDLGDVAELLPPVKKAAELCGHVTKQAAEETGLKEGTPVATGCYDIDTAALAAGVMDDSYINVIVGSWANNQYIKKQPVISKDYFSVTVFATGEDYLMLEGSPSGAMNLEWFVETLLPAEQTGSVYDICNAAIRDTQPQESELLFLPFVYGSNAGAHARGAFLGMEGWHTRKQIIRAVYEGVCFSHKWHIERMRQHGELPDIVRITGGATKSSEWRQMFADVLNMPVEMTNVTEAGTLGAAMCAGVCAGEYADLSDAVRRTVKIKDSMEPIAKNAPVYQNKYENYTRAIRALEAYWR